MLREDTPGMISWLIAMEERFGNKEYRYGFIGYRWIDNDNNSFTFRVKKILIKMIISIGIQCFKQGT